LNCQSFLIEQIKELFPRLIVAYGTDVCRWFYPGYSRDDDAYSTVKWLDIIPVLLIPQTQGGYSRPIIRHLQRSVCDIVDAFDSDE
jgi:hypothetical protein